MFLIENYIPGCSSLGYLGLLQFKLGLINSGSGFDHSSILAPVRTIKGRSRLITERSTGRPADQSKHGHEGSEGSYTSNNWIGFIYAYRAGGRSFAPRSYCMHILVQSKIIAKPEELWILKIQICDPVFRIEFAWKINANFVHTKRLMDSANLLCANCQMASKKYIKPTWEVWRLIY